SHHLALPGQIVHSPGEWSAWNRPHRLFPVVLDPTISPPRRIRLHNHPQIAFPKPCLYDSWPTVEKCDRSSVHLPTSLSPSPQPFAPTQFPRRNRRTSNRVRNRSSTFCRL